MPARAEWKGFLQVQQIQVPVRAFSACSSEPDITLNQLHRGCGERIRQLKHCPKHGPVETDAIIAGYQVAENCYLPIEPTELDQLRPAADKTIAVQCFVDCEQIDPVYFSGRTLYLVPDGTPGQRPFMVLREGLRASRRHAFSKIVLSRRECLVLLRPMGRLLAMTVMEYPQRVRSATDYDGEVLDGIPSSKESELIGRLIEALTDEAFDLSGHRDRYHDGLNALIEQMVAAADLVSPEPAEEQAAVAEQGDDAMVAMLEASLTAAGVPATPPRLKAVTPFVPKDAALPIGHAS
jgi:DNA end-binding protein Ku